MTESFSMANPNPILSYTKESGVKCINNPSNIFWDNMSPENKEDFLKDANKCFDNSLKIQREYKSSNRNFLVTFVSDSTEVKIFTQDISELLKIQNDLQIKEENIRAIFNAIPGFLSWINKDLKYLGVNEKLSKVYDLEPDFFIGKTFGFMQGNTTPDMYKILEDFFKSKVDDIQFEVELRLGDDLKTLILTGHKYRNGEEVILFGVDITEQRKIQKELAQEQKKSEMNQHLASIGFFQASLFHEINNPLSIATSSIELLQNLIQEDSPKASLDNINKISKSLEMITNITKGIKRLSRFDLNDDGMEIESIDNLLKDINFIYNHKINKYEINLEILNTCMDGDTICCYVTQVAQVFINLINNSIDAIKDLKERWIKIIISNFDEKLIKISIIDSGKGISESINSKVFDSFFTTKKKGEGTGIGLSLSRKIIEEHQGKIEINTNDANTQFDIYLPKA